MNNADLRALYGLKYNPFLPALPPEALFALPGVDAFAHRLQTMAAQGGFALITGEPGHGKSKTLQSDRFDSHSLLFIILCGDGQLPERFRGADLLPLGSRIGPRLLLTPQLPELLQEYLNFALEQAGCPHLMTDQLIRTLAAHAANNMRVLNNMAAELLAAAAERNLPRIDESLFFELFSPTGSKPRRNHKKPIKES